ncbi:mechanosensitive ion channel [Babesia ovata]|uniref:Mechanosensitive ion channel n=1 Tax=Babesia ovata TaxID=189622 RepID=A0A2H6KEZ8_9APIC|nr:mechanosensitive ion channel [Babesia ovata]GBE61565.1 mechanosensitive ion channel [Babesia ovata]
METRDSQIEILSVADDETIAAESREKAPAFAEACCDEDEEESAEIADSCLHLNKLFHELFPDRQVAMWMTIHAAIILIYALFNFNAYTVFLQSQNGTINFNINMIWCLLFIWAGNLIMYIGTMIIRYLLINVLVNVPCSRNAYVFASISMLDPALFYLLWAATQSVVWQILVSRLKDEAHMFCIEPPFWHDFTHKYLIFREDAMVWITCAIHVHLILAIRSLTLAVISFTFELNLLVNSNEALKKYLKLYTNIRKFNIDWLALVISRPELVKRLKKAFLRKQHDGKIFPMAQSNSDRITDFKKQNALHILHESHETAYMQYFSTKEDLSVPSDTTDAMIDQSTTSAFSNWLLIYYVIRVPPVISLLREDVVLRGRAEIESCAAMLFEQMYMTLNARSIPGEETDDTQSVSGVRDALAQAKDSTEAVANGKPEMGTDAVQEVHDRGSKADHGTDNAVGPDVSKSSVFKATGSDDNTAAAVAEERGSASGKPPVVRIVEPPRGASHGHHQMVPASEISQQATTSVSKVCTSPSKVRIRNHRTISMMHLEQFRNSLMESEASEEFPDDSPTADYQFNSVEGEDSRFICMEQMRSFLLPKECDTIMSLLDLSRHGKINQSMLQQALLNLFSTQKKFTNTIRGQDSVFKVLSRLLSVATWVLAIVTMAFLAGITAEAIVVSGAALLSALTVALSYLYTNFVTSVIFVAFSNPYNVGDRVRLNDGEPLTVRKIRTYTTEFVTMLGKVVVYQNAVLSTMKITNESRAARATVNYQFKVDAETTEEQLVAIESYLKNACNMRPNDFVKDSCIMFYLGFNPGHCFDLSVWVTCIESWANWQRIYLLKGELLELTLRQCKKLGVTYMLPTQPMTFPHTLSIRNVQKREPSQGGKQA